LRCGRSSSGHATSSIPSFAERIGDVAPPVNGRFTIADRTPGESLHLHIGNCGGASEEEMTVPLIVAVI
jgi:hypothetical protein